MTIKQALEEVASTSAAEVVSAAIARAKGIEGFNAFISITEESALERAAKVDSGEIKGRLAGVPFAVKDNFLVADTVTTAAASALSSFKAPVTATSVKKLEAEGAILIGKVNLDAFAHGGSTENSAYGVTRNAVDETRVAGGSSGGSAVAVAKGVVPFALGSDTGGSIRQPASFNGVVGHKPTYGSVSRYGVISMASSTDTVGVLSYSVEDAATVMGIISGEDNLDPTTVDGVDYSLDVKSAKRIGILTEGLGEGVDEDVKQSVRSAVAELEKVGYSSEEVSMSMIKYSLAMYYIIVPAEISSNLARFDGVRFGTRSEDVSSLDDLYKKSRAQGLMYENKRRIMIGSYVLSSGYFDAYYQKAQKARTLLIEEYNKLFEKYDVLVSPVAPNPAFTIGENLSDPIKMYIEDALTVPVSLAGLPAVSVPVKPTASGLPVGLQVIGNRMDDGQVLAVAKDVEATING